MADVVLIRPGEQGRTYGDLRHTLTAVEPPAWARMIAGWLRDHGYNVAIIDQEAENLTADQVAERVRAQSPHLAVIVVEGHQPSASTQQMDGASEIARAFVRLDPPVIIVGNHASALPDRTYLERANDNHSYICDGEGPLTIAEFLNKTPLEDIPGLVWWHPYHDVVKNKTAPLVPIDQLHGDVWDLLPMDKYRAHNWQCLDGSPRQPYASIYTTLGCPFRCSFCMINTFQHSNTYRRRDPAKVVKQVRHLYEVYGVRTLKIADEMFVLDPSHYLPICEGLAQLPFADELNIWAYARIDTVKPETLSLMRRAGIRWLALGIESASSHVRDGAQKRLKDDDIRETVRVIQDAGINALGNFIFGLPDDTQETMRATLALAQSLDLDFANFYAAMAYPGSRLFDEARQEDLPESWSGYSQHSYDTKPLPTRTLSSAHVLAFRDAAHHRYFEDPDFLERTERKFGAEAVAMIRDMTAVRLPRKLLEVS